MDESRGKVEAHQIKIPQPLRRVREINNRIIRQVSAISQTQFRESRELELAPMLEPLVRDSRTPCQINLLKSARSMICHMRHTPIRNMFAVTQC